MTPLLPATDQIRLDQAFTTAYLPYDRESFMKLLWHLVHRVIEPIAIIEAAQFLLHKLVIIGSYP